MREVYTRWMKQNGGAIVNMIADIWHGWPNFAHSGASRGGMLTLSESAASEWAAAGVRVNTVAPGAIASSGLDTYDPKDREFIQRQVTGEHPAQPFRFGSGSFGGDRLSAVAGGRLHNRLLHSHRRRRAKHAQNLGRAGEVRQEQAIQRLSSRRGAGNPHQPVLTRRGGSQTQNNLEERHVGKGALRKEGRDRLHHFQSAGGKERDRPRRPPSPSRSAGRIFAMTTRFGSPS